MSASLSGNSIVAFGLRAPLYGWPVLQVGVDPSGNPIALSLAADGTITASLSPPSGGFAIETGGNLASIKTLLAKPLTGNYETVAASQTAQVLGTTGAAGDYLSGLLVTPANTSPGNVIILDGATSITVFVGGATSVSNLVPFFVPIGAACVTAWKVTTGADVSVIGVGKFT